MTPQDHADFVTYIVKALVKNPDEVSIDIIEGERSVIFEVRVSEEDIGKVIGKQGRIARALSTLLQAATARQEKRYAIEILD